MTVRYLLLIALFVSVSPVLSQLKPVVGRSFTITYHPPSSSELARAQSMELVYAFNFWGGRTGTRLALLENVLNPDSGRAFRAPLTRTDLGWQATIDIPDHAAVLSYFVTDGVHRDDNRERTYTAYVVGPDGKPVRNAHFFMTPFLELAREPIENQVREIENETLSYPDNFRTYFLFFSKLLEQGKGAERVQKQIIDHLGRLETAHPDTLDVLNLAARTWHYLLRNTQVALSYKERIGIRKMWPEVFMIYDREKALEEKRLREMEGSSRRATLMNAEVPDVVFVDWEKRKYPLRELKGKPVVLFFWATTSPASRQMLEQLRSRVQTDSYGCRWIGVNIDVDIATARAFLENERWPFEHWIFNGDAVQRMGVTGVPYLFLIDSNLVVRSIIEGWGEDSEERLDHALRNLPR